MQYRGKLYGKVGNQYFPLKNTSDDFDALLKSCQGILKIINDSEGVSGYHRNGDIAEWDDFEEVRELEKAIKKSTE